MAIAYDASTEATGSTNPWSFTHTPVGTPKGVVVFLFYSGTANTNDGSAITYGGVAMTKVDVAFDNTGEKGTVVAFFLGSGIPTGAQTVSITPDSTSFSMYAVAITVTAGGNTQLAGIGSAKVQGDTANPSVTITGISGASFGFGGLFSGLDAEASVSAGSGMTMRQSFDFGVETAFAECSTSPNASGNLTIAFTSASDDVAFMGLAIEEAAVAYTLALAQGSYALTGVALGMLQALTVALAQGSYTLAGVATALNRGYGIVAAVGSYILTGIDAGFTKTLNVAMALGTYALTGIAATLTYGYNMTLAVGSYTLTGFSLLFAGWIKRVKPDIGTWTPRSKVASGGWTNRTKPGIGSWTPRTKPY